MFFSLKKNCTVINNVKRKIKRNSNICTQSPKLFWPSLNLLAKETCGQCDRYSRLIRFRTLWVILIYCVDFSFVLNVSWKVPARFGKVYFKWPLFMSILCAEWGTLSNQLRKNLKLPFVLYSSCSTESKSSYFLQLIRASSDKFSRIKDKPGIIPYFYK